MNSITNSTLTKIGICIFVVGLIIAAIFGAWMGNKAKVIDREDNDITK